MKTLKQQQDELLREISNIPPVTVREGEPKKVIKGKKATGGGISAPTAPGNSQKMSSANGGPSTAKSGSSPSRDRKARTEATGAAEEKEEKKPFKGAPEREPGESDAEYLKRIVRMANSRMASLEKLSDKEGFESILEWAYASAYRDIHTIFSREDEGARFSAATKGLGENEIKKRINAVVRFLNSATSTKRGILSVYNKRVNTLNERYGTDFTWQDVGAFWESELVRKMTDEYGSDTVLRVVGTLDRMPLKDIRRAISKNKRITKDKVLNEDIKQILSDYDLSEIAWVFGEDTEELQDVQKMLRR